MSFKVAVITGYLKNPGFVQLLLESLNRQSFNQFDTYVYAAPMAEYFLDESYLKSLNYDCFQLKLKENSGFAGNNNYAIKSSLKNHSYKYIVLVNDDTIVHRDWLKELVATAENSAIEKIGAVASKMVFYQRFVTLTGLTTTTKHGRRNLGIRFYANSRFECSFYNKRFYSAGFYSQEEDEIYDYRWSMEEFKVELPVEPTPEDHYVLKLFIKKNHRISQQALELSIGETFIETLELDADKLHYAIRVPKALVEKNWHFIIQNAGSAITPTYSGYDVGAGEIDTGQYEREREIETFCGGSFLIRTDALIRTGLFIDGLFCYYEDSDLSIRLKKQGYKIVYNPKSIIQHYHTGSSKEWSPFFTYHAFRNKIIFSAKNFGFKAFIYSFKERLRETYIFFKLFIKSRFRNQHYKSRLRLNLLILKDSLIGIIKFKPSYIDENLHL